MLRALKYVCWVTLALWLGHYSQDVNNVSPTWELNSLHWESHVTFVIYLVVVFCLCGFFFYESRTVYTFSLLSCALIFGVIKKQLSVKHFVYKMCVCMYVK